MQAMSGSEEPGRIKRPSARAETDQGEDEAKPGESESMSAVLCFCGHGRGFHESGPCTAPGCLCTRMEAAAEESIRHVDPETLRLRERVEAAELLLRLAVRLERYVEDDPDAKGERRGMNHYSCCGLRVAVVDPFDDRLHLARCAYAKARESYARKYGA